MRCAVVGGGITGMATALGLARRGHDVELVEAGAQLGGVARAVRFGGHRFCPGPQYLWGFGDDEDATRLLRALDVVVPTLPMPATFEQLRLGDEPWSDVGHVVDASGDHRFVATLDALGRAGAAIEARASFRLDGPAMVRAVATHADADALLAVLRSRHHSVADLARACGASSTTVRRLLYSQGIFAERLQDLSAVVYAAARRHLQRTLRVPVDGVVALVDALANAATARLPVHLGERVLDLRSARDQLVLCTDRRELVVDHVVFCTSPGALPKALQTHGRAAFAPSHSIGTSCLVVELSSEERARLHHRNFSFFADHDDVAFDAGGAHTATINFTLPTLNGVADARAAPARQVVCVFFPLGVADDIDVVTARAEACLRAQLSAMLGRDVAFAEALRISPQTWTEHFGACDGAVYGRRLTSSSLRRTQVDRLPARVHLAHSGAGIPGVLGCLQLADAVVSEVV